MPSPHRLTYSLCRGVQGRGHYPNTTTKWSNSCDWCFLDLVRTDIDEHICPVIYDRPNALYIATRGKNCGELMVNQLQSTSTESLMFVRNYTVLCRGSFYTMSCSPQHSLPHCLSVNIIPPSHVAYFYVHAVHETYLPELLLRCYLWTYGKYLCQLLYLQLSIVQS